MEAFSLLKYWKGGGVTGAAGGSICSTAAAGGGCNAEDSANIRSSDASQHTVTTTTTVLTATDHIVDSDEDDDDEGPFFDLEFAVPEGEDDDEEDTVLERENGLAEVLEVEEVLVEEGETDSTNGCCNDGSGGGERKFKFTLSSSSSAASTTTNSSCSFNDCVDPNLPVSPSDDLFFKGRLLPIESSELLINSTDGEMNSKSHQFQVASLLKPATKFRVFMSDRLKKSKPAEQSKSQPPQDQEKIQEQQPKDSNSKEQPKQSHSAGNKFFTVKFKVEEVPIVSLFTRDHSSKGGGQRPSNLNTKKKTQPPQKEIAEEPAIVAVEKRNSKDVVQKYLNKVKPLYIRVSKRVGEKKLRLSGQLNINSSEPSSESSVPKQNQQNQSSESSETPPKKSESDTVPKKSAAKLPSLAKKEKSVVDQKVVVIEEDGSMSGEGEGLTTSCTGVGVKNGGNNLAVGFKVMCKHLGKSKSSSSAVVHSVPPAMAAGTGSSNRRRDDSLLQQQDGIQSAILHCKRSFNASRDSESSSVLSRSVSDPAHQEDEGNKAVGG